MKWKTQAEIMRRDGYRCVACGCEVGLHIDHIIPRSRGGDNSIDNLQVLCYSCNTSKSSKTMDEWSGPISLSPHVPKPSNEQVEFSRANHCFSISDEVMDLIRSCGGRANELIVYAVIEHWYATHDAGWPTETEIAMRIHTSPNLVRRAVARLREYGVIEDWSVA